MKIIVGLGNPDEKYKNTRHNTGFMVVDFLAEQKGLTWQLNKKFNAEITRLRQGFGGQASSQILLVKPKTYMNNSGQAVRAILDYYKLLPKKLGLFAQKNIDLSKLLTVIHDDVDFDLGVFKTQKNRSAGGHNGIKSIITHLKTQNFTRIRVGVANPLLREKISPEKFVLEKFSTEEKKKLEKLMPEIIENTVKK